MKFFSSPENETTQKHEGFMGYIYIKEEDFQV